MKVAHAMEGRSLPGPRHLAWKHAWLAAMVAASVSCAGAGAGPESSAMRDFPPVVEPGRQEAPVVQPTLAPPPAAAAAEADSARQEPYRLGVGDDLAIAVIGQPEFTRFAKVLPDGTISSPGAGTLYVLGKTPGEVRQELELALGRYVRYPTVELQVTGFGEQKQYVMGEVQIPADQTYQKGMTALQAIAQAGGFKDTADRSSVVVLRRTGVNQTEFYKLDLRGPLQGRDWKENLTLHAFDIVYVPKSGIATMNVFVDQFIRQNIAPLTFYLEGWNAFHVSQQEIIIRTR